jgi:hypothetical protein
VIVHFNVAEEPAGTPVTPEVADDGVVIVAVPLLTDHTPVPEVAALPASVNVLVLHCVWSVPAFATVAAASLVSTTSSEVEHVPFVIVHFSVAALPAVIPVTPDVADDGVVIVAVPLVTVHTPVPEVAALPASVNVLVLHCVWSVPAFATVAAASFVSTTSSVEVQVPLVIVQRRVAGVPAVTPVTPEVAELGVVIVAVPLTTLHAPVPEVAALPANVKEVLLHCVWSLPALATVAAAWFVSTTSSEDVQVPFVIVQRSVAGVPAVTPVTPDVAEDGVVIVAVPLTTLHAPVPEVAVLPASVKDVLLQLTISVPALATVAAASLVSTTSSVEVQVPLVIVHRSVADDPAGTPVTPEVAEEAVVIVAVPLTTLQAPVPEVAVLPASVNEPLLHCV